VRAPVEVYITGMCVFAEGLDFPIAESVLSRGLFSK